MRAVRVYYHAKMAGKPEKDWRQKITDSMAARVDRLMRIEAGGDDKAALDAIKVLVALSGEELKPPPSDLPTTPLFALPTDTQMDLGIKKGH